MLIKEYDLEVTTTPSEIGSAHCVTKAHFAVNISEALPYLNATLAGAIYFPHYPSLMWKDGEYRVVFHAHEIAAEEMDDREEAALYIAKIIGLVNDTWENRAAITPDYEARRPPAPAGIYKLLPRTNCRQCGEETCFNFALKVSLNQVKLSACVSLQEAKYADNLVELRAMLPDDDANG